MRAERPTSRAWIGVVVLALLLVGGLFYVKWDPYFHKALGAAIRHTLGASIVSGRAAAAPAVGWRAAWAYTVAYGKDIWEALLLGLVLGAGVQAAVPRDWLARVLGAGRYRSTAIGGVAALPSMM